MTYKETLPYLYKWTNKVTGKWYIGSKTKKGWSPARHEEYICSCGTLLPLIKAKREEWEYEILLVGAAEDARYIFELEGRLLRRMDARGDPMSYNQHNNDNIFNSTGIPRSPITIEKQRKKMKQLVADGNHNLLKRADGSSVASDRVNAGTHHLLSGDIQRAYIKKQLEAGTSHLLGENNPSHARVVAGTHHFQTTTIGLDITKKRMEAGTHNFQINHPSKQKITCIHCGKTVCKSAHTRCHGDNCKQKDTNGNV